MLHGRVDAWAHAHAHRNKHALSTLTAVTTHRCPHSASCSADNVCALCTSGAAPLNNQVSLAVVGRDETLFCMQSAWTSGGVWQAHM